MALRSLSQLLREKDQPFLAELFLVLRQPHDVEPPGQSPLLVDADVVNSLRFYFLRARVPLTPAQLPPPLHAFRSGPLPGADKKRPRQHKSRCPHLPDLQPGALPQHMGLPGGPTQRWVCHAKRSSSHIWHCLECVSTLWAMPYLLVDLPCRCQTQLTRKR